jgi:hypothetical protein
VPALLREQDLSSIRNLLGHAFLQTWPQTGVIKGALMGEMKRAIAREREAWAEKMQERTRMKSTLVIAASIIAAVRLAREELQAVEWYRKAAKQGHIEARFDLGLCHSDGAGNLDEDYEQGYQGSNDGKEMATGFECRRRSSLVERSVETPTLSHGITVSQKQSSSVFNQLSQSRLDRVLGSRRAAVSGVEEDA